MSETVISVNMSDEMKIIDYSNNLSVENEKGETEFKKMDNDKILIYKKLAPIVGAASAAAKTISSAATSAALVGSA